MSEPDTKAYGDSWYAATMVEAPPRPSLSLDLDVDVCVIGGGLAGLTTAREVARRGWSVVLLEAGRLAQSASGRNTGFVLPGFGADADKLVARVGFERAKDLWSLAQAGLDYVRATIRAENAPGIDPQNGWLYVSKKDNNDEFVSYVGVLGELGCEIEGWPTERVRAVLRSERYFYAINYLQAITIHPLNYALALAAAAERDGARIFEHTPALSIDPTGVRKRIVTPGARLRADHVVLCGNVELGAADAAPCRHAVAGDDLCHRHGAARRTACRSGRLSRRRQRFRPRRQSLPHRRRRSLDAVGPRDRVGEGSAPLCRRADRRHQKNLSAARRRHGRLCLGRHPGHYDAPDAADRRTWAGRLARQRLRRPWAEHHGDGRQYRRARDRRRRRDLAAIHAVRIGLGGRRVRPGRGADARLDQAAARSHRRAPRQGARTCPPSGA